MAAARKKLPEYWAVKTTPSIITIINNAYGDDWIVTSSGYIGRDGNTEEKGGIDILKTPKQFKKKVRDYFP